MRDKYKAVAKIIEAAMHSLYRDHGHCDASRLRDGTRVWRIVGSNNLSKRDDGKIYLWRNEAVGGPIEITADDAALGYYEQRQKGLQPPNSHWSCWEWHVINDPEKFEAHLTAVLKQQQGLAVEVSVGARSATAHATSIAVYLLSGEEAHKQALDTGLADPSVAAIAVIMGALLPLGAPVRRRVLDYVLAQLSDQEAA